MPEATLEFIGTATTLLRIGPFTVLTDPNFLHRGQYAYLGKGLVSRRRTEPAMTPAELPELDAIVLSHLHGDHFDRVARRELRRDVPLLTTRQAAPRLERWGFPARGLPRWGSHLLERDGVGLTVTATPGRHAPGPAQALLPPVMGSVLELDTGSGAPFRAYVTGDTLYRRSLRRVVDRLGPIDAMVIHLGGTRVLGLLVTMDDRQGARLVRTVQPAVTVPIHYDDYGVFRSPLEDFEQRWAREGLPGELHLVARGETVSLRPD